MIIKTSKNTALTLYATAFAMVILTLAGSTPALAGTGPHHFLWKPVSESDGKLAILFPNSFMKENVKDIEIISAAGTERPHSVTQNGHNGNRIHARFGKGGSQYPAPATVKITMKDGSARVWQVNDTSNRHEEISKGQPAQGSSGGNGYGGATNGGLDSVLGGDSSSSVGVDDTYVFSKTGTVEIEACLLTYGQASLSVNIINSAGDKENFMSWSRSGDADSSRLKVQGEEIAESNKEVKPGDWTAQKVTIPLSGEKGEKIILNLKGSFGAATPILKVLPNNILTTN